MFEPTLEPKDTETERTCGCCGELKTFDQFYLDGKTSKGEPKYRRDCKECYRVTRLRSRKAKRAPEPRPPRQRRKRK